MTPHFGKLSGLKLHLANLPSHGCRSQFRGVSMELTRTGWGAGFARDMGYIAGGLVAGTVSAWRLSLFMGACTLVVGAGVLVLQLEQRLPLIQYRALREARVSLGCRAPCLAFHSAFCPRSGYTVGAGSFQRTGGWQGWRGCCRGVCKHFAMYTRTNKA